MSCASVKMLCLLGMRVGKREGGLGGGGGVGGIVLINESLDSCPRRLVYRLCSVPGAHCSIWCPLFYFVLIVLIRVTEE